MADPFTMAAIGIGSSIFGGVTTAVGNVVSGVGQSNQYKYQAGIAQQNAAIAKQNAAYTLATGERQQWQEGLKGRQQLADIRTAQSGSNLDMSFGSPAQVQDSAVELNKLDQANIREAATRKSYGQQLESWKYASEANAYKSASKSAMFAGGISAVSSLLGTASSVSSKWMQGTQVGLFS